MAITVLNTTSHANTPFSHINNINIPATTEGATLIAITSSRAGGGGTAPQVYFIQNEDWDGMSLASSGWVEAIQSSLHNGQVTQIWYRSNVPAGLTTITAYALTNTNGFYMAMIQATGVNILTPVLDTSMKTDTTTAVNPTCLSVTTASTDALYVGGGIASLSGVGAPNVGGGSTPWIKISSPAGNTASDRCHAYQIGTGTKSAEMNRTTNSTMSWSMASAIFNPEPNSFELEFNESISVTDNTADNEVDYDRLLSESMTLTDFLDMINFSNNQFKSLSDTLGVADTLATILSAFRTLTENVFLSDTITIQHNAERTLLEEIRLTEWMSIKKTNSTRWGD